MLFSQPRPLCSADYHKRYIQLLSELTTVVDMNSNKISEENFCKFVLDLSKNHIIMVIEDLTSATIVATGTLLIEPKIIHGLGHVGHIEDVVVLKNQRGSGLGNRIITTLVQLAQHHSCYKIVLDSTAEGVPFYEKNGFIRKEQCMMRYLVD